MQNKSNKWVTLYIICTYSANYMICIHVHAQNGWVLNQVWIVLKPDIKQDYPD